MMPTSKDRERRIPIHWETIHGETRLLVDGEVVDTFDASMLERWCRAMRADGNSVAYTPMVSVLEAIRHLREKPRDARGARQILHDWICMSEHCDPKVYDHASTQTGAVRILRKVMEPNGIDGFKHEDEPSREWDMVCVKSALRA